MNAQTPAQLAPFFAPTQLPGFINQLDELHELILAKAETLDAEELEALHALFTFSRALRKLQPET